MTQFKIYDRLSWRDFSFIHIQVQIHSQDLVLLGWNDIELQVNDSAVVGKAMND